MRKFVVVLLLLVIVVALFVVTLPCSNCQETGKVTDKHVVRVTCTHCGGTGRIERRLKKQSPVKFSLGETGMRCLFCKGKGYKERITTEEEKDCPVCDGSGRISIYKWVAEFVRINVAPSEESASESSVVEDLKSKAPVGIMIIAIVIAVGGAIWLIVARVY